jgi:arylsulfatase A-like enzyme
MPGKVPAGFRVRAPVGLHQIAATVAALTGTDQHPFPGETLDTFWSGTPPADPAVVSEVAGDAWPGVPRFWPIYQGAIRSLVTERWHLVLTGSNTVELFDWNSDPREEHNLASDPEHTEVVAELRQRLQSAMKQK